MSVLVYAKRSEPVAIIKMLLCVATMLFSCGQGADPADKRVRETRLVIDTNRVAATIEKLRQLPETQADSIAEGIITALRGQNNYVLLLQYLQRYKAIRPDTGRAAAFVANERGYAYNYVAQYDSALVQFGKAADYYKRRRMLAQLGDTYIGMGIDYAYLGDYPAAFDCHYKALTIGEAQRDSGKIYRTKTELAIDHYYQKDYRKAIDLALNSLAYYRQMNDPLRIAYVESVLATLYYNTDDYPTSIAYAEASLAIRRQYRIERDIAESLNNLSLAQMALSHWDEAIIALTESLELMQKVGDIRQIPIIKQNLAHCIWRKGNATKAKKMLHEVVQVAASAGQKDAVANAYRKLSNIYRDEHLYDSSLYSFKKYKAWSDSMFSSDKEKAIRELSVKYETEKKESKIAQLEVERALNKTRQMVYLILFGFTVVVATLLILLLTIRNKQKSILIEKARMQLEMNQRDLANFTEHIIAKNKFINELEAKQEELKATQVAVGENSESLSQLYQFKILTEDDWRQFKIHFDKVYPGFITMLRNRYPDLAPAEERQFLLIKLNISNKECADMLGISLPGVKKNRYRLKKRFGLLEQDDLDEFVKNVS